MKKKPIHYLIAGQKASPMNNLVKDWISIACILLPITNANHKITQDRRDTTCKRCLRWIEIVTQKKLMRG